MSDYMVPLAGKYADKLLLVGAAVSAPIITAKMAIDPFEATDSYPFVTTGVVTKEAATGALKTWEDSLAPKPAGGTTTIPPVVATPLDIQSVDIGPPAVIHLKTGDGAKLAGATKVTIAGTGDAALDKTHSTIVITGDTVSLTGVTAAAAIATAKGTLTKA